MGIVLNTNRGSPVLTLLVPLLVRLSNPLVQLWNRVVLDITICQAYPFLELSSNYIVFSSDFIKQSVAVKQHVISNIGNTGINHRLITIQIEHFMSSFQDLGVFRSQQTAESEAKRNTLFLR